VGESEGSNAPGEFFFTFFPFWGVESAALAKLLVYVAFDSRIFIRE
jgi:hypothetical protein